MSDPSSRESRAAARRARLVGQVDEGGPWAGGLVDRDQDRPPVGRTEVERLQMVREASERAWALSGRPFPDDDRASMPGRVRRAGEPE